LSPDSDVEMFDNGSETTLGAQGHGNHGHMGIKSLTQSFSTANITNDTFPITGDIGDEQRPPPFHLSPVSGRSVAERASDRDGQPAIVEMKSVLKAKIHTAAKTMSEEEKVGLKKLRDLKRKLLSKEVGAAEPSSVVATRKYGKCSIKNPLSHTHHHGKILQIFVGHRPWGNQRD
jgi:hypothetical protein